MKRSQLGSPEDSYKRGIPTDIDIERGEKEKKEGRRAGTLERVSLRIHAWGSHVQRTLRHFPPVLLSFLMLSSLYPDATVPLCIAFITFIIITIVGYTFVSLKSQELSIGPGTSKHYKIYNKL